MRITLHQSGTIVGIRQALGPLDTSADVESGMLEALVMAADFFELPDHYESDVRDGLHKGVTVDDGKRSKAVWWNEPDLGDVPEALKDLFGGAEKVAKDHGRNWTDEQA